MPKKLTTISEYARRNNISVQAVHQQKKLTVVNLPLLVIYEGEQFQIGNRKMVVEDK